MKERNQGITLIALVITIIVILILAGVTIETLTGNNGLIIKTNKAQEATKEKTAEERIKAEVLGSYGLNGKIIIKDLKINLKNIKNPEAIFDENAEEFPLLVELDGYKFEINEYGSVETAKERWKENDDGTFSLNDTTVKIGDYINYDAKIDNDGNEIPENKGTYISYSELEADLEKNNGRTNGTAGNIKFELKNSPNVWRVLGITEDGKLKLVSENGIDVIWFNGYKRVFICNRRIRCYK